MRFDLRLKLRIEFSDGSI